MITISKKRLLTTTIFCSALVAFDGAAQAQDAGSQPAAQDVQAQDQSATGAPQAGTDAPTVAAPAEAVEAGQGEIVVTGSIFRRTNTETPSPVTVLSSESLARRGITNVADAVRSISADNSGSVPNAFSAGFGAGAQAPSLRGLTVNSTLTLVDGLRVVNYPAADDGQRVFVDLNTMPRVSIERIEVLKDGASSTYGADAIGGVVNVIQRKQFNGLEATAEAGTSQHGGGDQFRGSVLAGWGDYADKGVNLYVGAEFETNSKIYARDRGFPFNTADLSSIDGGLDTNWNLINGFTGTPAIVRPATQLIPGNLLSGVANSTGPGANMFTVLNPAQCTGMGGTIVTDPVKGQACAQNGAALYGEIQPKTTRFGFVGRVNVQLNDNTEAYAMLSWYRSNLTTGGAPQSLRVADPTTTTGFVLPNYICDDGVDCDNDATRRLNPYNPYAAAGPNPETRAAQLFYRFAEMDTNARFHSDVFRGAGGVSGTIGDAWNYQVDASASVARLRNIGEAVSIAGFSRAIATGTYNLLNPEQNSQAVRDQVIVDYDYTSSAALYMAQGIISRPVAELPGGPMQLGLGAHFRHESLDNPNSNPTADLIALNQVHAKGARSVAAGFFEISAPIVEQLELQASGRYDHYSTGFSAFSPKVGFKLTPVRQIALRGTWSKGFRAPSFTETTGDVVGYTNFNHGNYEVVCVEHGGTWDDDDGCSGASSYAKITPLGYRNGANPDLKPEHSRSFTFGTVVQPVKWFSFTVDYYNIRKTDVITGGPLSNAAIDAYYAGGTLPAGYSVVLNPADPLHPSGIRTVATIVGPYANAASLSTSGVDFAAQVNARISSDVRFSSNLEVTDIFKYNFHACGDKANPDCGKQRYVGTQGPYILSSGAGTPKWRGNWSNSLDFGRATLTATAYYVSGYYNTAEDQSGVGTYKDCAYAGDLYNDEVLCKTKSFITVDAVGSYKLTDNITAYVNVLNLFDAKAPLNAPNYAANNYNPTYTQAGAVGRFFRVGANIKFGPRERMAPVEAAPIAPPPPPATQTCADGTVILATEACPVAPPPPPPPPAAPERG